MLQVPTGPLAYARSVLPEIEAKPTPEALESELSLLEERRSRVLQSVVDTGEQIVGADFDRDGDVGLGGSRYENGLQGAALASCSS